jgi:nucleotide-binding universal stress UspA family protein
VCSLPFAGPAASCNVSAMAGRIVVGVDGSEAGDAALRWAADIARMREARLVVVHAWTFIPPAPLSEPGLMAVPAGDLVGDLEVESQAADAVLDEALERVGVSELDVDRRVVEDSAGEALVAAADGADLLVVGSHGHGAIGAALLGSVSRHAEKHASCEVMIIRPKRDERGE